MKTKVYLTIVTILVIVSCFGCASGTDNTIKKYGKEAADVIEQYLDLKTDTEEAYDKIRLIDDKTSAYYTKEEDAEQGS